MTYDNHPDGEAPHRRTRPDAAQRPGQRRRASDEAVAHPTRAARLAAQTNEGVGRAYGLTALGTLLPGAGLIATRRRLIGVPLLLLALGTGVAALYYLVRNGAFRSALDLAARPDLLRVLAVVLAVGGVIWISSVVLTALTARPRRMTGGQRVGLTAFTGVMCLLIAAPTALGLRYIDAHNNAVEHIFTGASDRPPNEGVPSVGPAVGETDPWADVPRVNVLLLGSDAADEREGVRTDSMMVASIDTASGDMVLFGIPRNLQKVPIPTNSPLYKRYGDSFDCGNECLMNAIWTAAENLHEENPGWFAGDPNPGQTATRQVISTVIGQPIHYTVIIDLDGFEALVDAMGGVDITVQERVPIGGRTYTDANGGIRLVEGSESGWIELGPQHLSGKEALWYSRSRVTSDDFSRMRRQRCVVGALVDQVNPLTLLQRYPAIASAAGDHITADIDQTELPAWAELVERVQGGTMRSLPFTSKNTNTVDPDYTAIRREVYLALHPEPTPSVEASSDDAGETTAAPTTEQPTTEEPTTEEPTGAETPTDDAEETTEPTDELAELGTVC
ncbi:LCP family protein [Ornithinimicrobium sp. F0845]|uniref:LCP family glycopolymer transferase n=1 Tax=Ornithinimicrobium sp. F0845 TaxID=2926412 RepID=UPI001FF36D56|nr:LCP family protein [Ornithinimicrobium sp. F0845]MCK0111976.1 LCP family protein [Ornithinimicrobium sp. F0845]